MHILVVTDADFVLADIIAALAGPDTSFTVCRNGRDVAGVVTERTPDIGIFDLQIGSMGGMAVTMQLRLDESAGLLPYIPVLMLLDRRADVHLAKRSAADGWVIKPLDPLMLQRAVKNVLAGAAERRAAAELEDTGDASVPAAAAESTDEEEAVGAR